MPGALVLRLALDLAPSERGGRRRPLTAGYRASLSFGRRRRGVEPIVHDAVLVLEDAAELAPGEHGTARAWIISPDELPGSLHEGSVATLLESDRIIARAEVLALLDDPTPRPLHDLADAGTRRLGAWTRSEDT